ncbi:hypothetical protein [Alteribacillus sp. HJP-4]
MNSGRYVRGFLLANVAVVLTFIFLPVFILTDNIHIYQSMMNYLIKS